MMDITTGTKTVNVHTLTLTDRELAYIRLQLGLSTSDIPEAVSVFDSLDKAGYTYEWCESVGLTVVEDDGYGSCSIVNYTEED